MNHPLLGVALRQSRAAQSADNNWIPELSSCTAWPETSGFSLTHTHARARTHTHARDQQVDLINVFSQENCNGKNPDRIFTDFKDDFNIFFSHALTHSLVWKDIQLSHLKITVRKHVMCSSRRLLTKGLNLVHTAGHSGQELPA